MAPTALRGLLEYFEPFSISKSQYKGTRKREWETKYAIMCLLCGGQHCLRCSEYCALRHMKSPIRGLHCDWITDSILAMQRPSTVLIEKYELIKHLKKAGITMVLNLTQPGEHPYCGNGLEASSGFPYLPEVFMNAGIQFLNYAWEDMTVPASSMLFNIVRVTSLHIATKGKIAVHCHAGYGRTGLVIACIILYMQGIFPQEVINLVRRKRPGSIQTSAQCLAISDFNVLLQEMKVVYPFNGGKKFSLGQYLGSQSFFLGNDEQYLRWVPRCVFLTTKVLIHLQSIIGSDSVLEAIIQTSLHDSMSESLSSDYAANRSATTDVKMAVQKFVCASNAQRWDVWYDTLNQVQHAKKCTDIDTDPHLIARIFSKLLISWFEMLEYPAISFSASKNGAIEPHLLKDVCNTFNCAHTSTKQTVLTTVNCMVALSKGSCSAKYKAACWNVSIAMLQFNLQPHNLDNNQDTVSVIEELSRQYESLPFR